MKREDVISALFKVINGGYRLSYFERAEIVRNVTDWIIKSIPHKVSIPQVYPEGNDYEKGWNACIEETITNLCRLQDADSGVRKDTAD